MTPESEASGEPRPNPFAVRYVRPGAVPYVFLNGETTADLLAAFDRLGRRVQVVGPHGSGKSTLAAALAAEWKSRGRQVALYALHQGGRSLPATDAAGQSSRSWNSNTIVIVDGAEQLWWWNRQRLVRSVRRADAGLLLTTHRSLGLPTLRTTEPDLAIALAVARHLRAPDDRTISDDDVTAAFYKTHGNLRETLFALFDVFQRRNR